MKPLSDLTHDERAALTGPALWWYALQVMGGEVKAYDEDDEEMVHYAVELPTGSTMEWRGDYIWGYGDQCDTEWNLFGLAVEWIEARGMIIQCHVRPLEKNYWFGAQTSDDRFGVLWCEAPTLPDAAARWIVEYGAKIKEAKP